MKEILRILEKIAPLQLSEDYDARNGIQVEGPNVDVTGILTCLDVTPLTVKKAIESSCQLIISHHQPILTPLKTILKSDWYGEIAILALKHDITIYSVHTPYDAVEGGLNDYVGKLIGLEEMYPLQHHGGDLNSPHGMGRLGKLKEPVYLDDFAAHVRESLNASTLKVVGKGKRMIQKVALGTGNGLALISTVLKSGADVYVTGDVQYRDMRGMVQNGMSLIAVEHDDTEKFFSKAMGEAIKRFLPSMKIVEYNDKFYHTLN